MAETLLHSPLEAVHHELGARLVEFAGWKMPILYRSILEEHRAVRERAGVFDISHMGQFFVRGANSAEWLNRMLCNDLARLDDGQGQYTMLLNERGGVIDDLIVYRLAPEEFLMVVNASMVEADRAWLDARLGDGVSLSDESADWAGMAVQGPDSCDAFARVFPDEVLPPRNGIARLAGGSIVCRTGYTGEDGFELFVPSDAGAAVFGKLIDAGAEPCGLGARDSLRLEMAYPLNGNDLSPERTPLEAGLGFCVALSKPEFIGREILERQKAEGLRTRLAAIELVGKGAPPRAHYPVLSEEGEPLGELCSGGLSPSLQLGIGLAYLPVDHAKAGTALQIDVRGRRFPARVVKKPFFKPQGK